MSKKSTKRLVFEALWGRTRVPCWELNKITFRYSDRIFLLRKDGVDIKTEFENRMGFYTIVNQDEVDYQKMKKKTDNHQ